MKETKKQRLIPFADIPRIIQSASDKDCLLLIDPVVSVNPLITEHIGPYIQNGAVKQIDVAYKLLSVSALEEVFTKCGSFKPRLIIAIGGGTVLDTAKLVNIVYSYSYSPHAVVTHRYSDRPLIPAIAVPTTAGTGSEATHFAVVYKDDVKYSVADNNLVPDYVVLAAEFTMSMPRSVVAHTGFDAFAQAIESYWSINSTDESKHYSRQALDSIKKHFVESVLRGAFVSRQAMQQAAYMAGKAINIAQTTAAHAISYPMSSFFHIPHGLAVFLTLPTIFKYNQGVSTGDCADPRGVAYVNATMHELAGMISQAGVPADEVLRSFFSTFSISPRLSDYGITSEQNILDILDNGFNPQRMKNNPRRISRETLSFFLRELQ